MNIYSSDISLDDKIGKVVTIPELTDENSKPHFNVRVMIMRKATEEEYLAQVLNRYDTQGFYYEMSID